jgi:hypothetical protein
MGYRWHVGNGIRVLFWEDTWIGNCCLAVAFWDLYVIANEHHCTIASVWDGQNLMITFRRTVSAELYDRWLELVELVNSISLSNEEDQPLWIFHPSGTYSVKSFYGVINNGGVVPIHSPAVWKLWIPPRIHIFLWLVLNNKILTRDNLGKRRHVDDKTCVFCSEPETAGHLFFDCLVAQHVWSRLSDIFNIPIGSDFLSVARWWISNDKNGVLNVFSSAVLWSIWTLRNEFCFQGRAWSSLDVVFGRVVTNVRSWRLLCKDALLPTLDINLMRLDKCRKDLMRIAW